MQKLASECSVIEIGFEDKKVLSSRSEQPDLERVASTQIGDPSSNPWLVRHFTESKNESFSIRPEDSAYYLKDPEIQSARKDENNKQPDSPTNNLTERFVQEGFEALENIILSLPTIENMISVNEERLSPKKWVISELHKLGLCENEIVQGIEYIDTQRDISNKEELLKSTVDVLLREQEQHQLESERSERKNTRENSPHKENPGKDLSFSQVLQGVSMLEEGKYDQSRIVIEFDEKENRKQQLMDKIKPKTLDDKEKLFSCGICLESFASFQTDSPLKCQHMFCWYCYKYYLNEKLDTNKVLNISCPTEGCNEIFEDHHIEKYLNQYTYSRYKRLKDAAVLAQNPNVRWCIRPGCSKYIIGKPNSKKVVCECGMQICFKCSNQYHSFWSCDSVIDKVYKKYAEVHNIQSCPQCKYKTEKNGGCDHITCVKCSYEWCWLCGLQYTKDHYENENPNKCIKLQKQKPKSPIDEKYAQWSSRICRNPLLILALPFIIIFLSAYLPIWLYECHRRKKSESKEVKISTTTKIFLGLLGTLFLPINFLALFVLWTSTAIRNLKARKQK